MVEGPAPCHVYLTLPEDPAHKIFVNFQTEKPVENPTIYFDTTSRSGPLSSYSNTTSGKGFAHKTRDFNRGIYWVLLDNLSPSTGSLFILFIPYISVYYFRVGYGTDESNYSPENSFSTLPATGPLHFVTGGDLSVTEDANKVLKHLSSNSYRPASLLHN